MAITDTAELGSLQNGHKKVQFSTIGKKLQSPIADPNMENDHHSIGMEWKKSYDQRCSDKLKNA